MKRLLTTCAFIGFAALAGQAIAAPIGANKSVGAEGLVSKVATYVCSRDDRGWHYMRGSHRMKCRPAIPHGGAKVWGWRCEGPRCGWWHRHDHRWND
jgi:hypothetical protein